MAAGAEAPAAWKSRLHAVGLSDALIHRLGLGRVDEGALAVYHASIAQFASKACPQRTQSQDLSHFC